MKLKGSIDPNYDALEELFDAVIKKLASHQTRLAIWFMEEVDLSPLVSQSIGAESPFPDSNSVLAGFGLLIELESVKVEELMQILTVKERLECEVLHIQIEFKGSVQFAAYDHFFHVFFGDEISLDVLETLKRREVIYGYKLWS